MYKLEFYVPTDHAQEVKETLFLKGAGSYQNYIRCSWETKGTGQFQPVEGSNPFIGEKGKLERVPEVKVEMIVRDEIIKSVIKSLILSHPYEEPAYSVIKLVDL